MNLINKNNKSIVLYNPFSNIGHFDSWCRIFVKILLQNEWTVVVITKNVNSILEILEQIDEKNRTQLIIFNQNSEIQNNKKLKIISQFVIKYNLFEYLDSIKIDVAQFNETLSNKFVKFYGKFNNFLIRKVEYCLLKILPQRIKISGTNPVEFAMDIDLIVKALGFKPSLVLNMYLDLYDPKPLAWRCFANQMTCKWGGIHMDMSNTLNGKTYSQSDKLKVIYTINEPNILNKSTENGDINYQWLPDVTDISLPEKKSSRTYKILNYAAGRSIIFLGGAIGGSKNISLWVELINKLDKKYWFFVQIGKVDYATLSESDLKALRKLQTTKIENLYISDTYLQHESELNEIMSISSIIWGLYRDFDRSSNILTKSALLSKPIIVSDRFLMGQRVNTYKIGVAVSEIDADAAKSGIEWLINNPVPLANFERYADVYSTNALSKKLNESLLKILND